MYPNDPRWRQHLDVVTAWGEASAANQTPPPTDDQLWAMSRIRQDLDLPGRIDDELLAELREAFNTGRQPTRIDLHVVADAIRARGVPALVEHTGGNTAALYTGEQRIDGYGDVRWSTSAGPGLFETPDRGGPSADTEDFRVGPDGDSWAIGIPAYATAEQIAEMVVAVTGEADRRLARFTDAVNGARRRCGPR